MTKLLDLANAVLDKLRDLLQGDALRAISYGSAVIIYFIARALGSIEDVSFEQAITSAGAAAAVIIGITETARRYVYSAKSVANMVTTPPTAAGPIAAAVEAGVQPEVIVGAMDAQPDSDDQP